MTLIAIALTALAVACLLAFLAAKRDGYLRAQDARHFTGRLARDYRKEAAAHYLEARKYLLASNLFCMAATIVWLVVAFA